MARHTTLRNLPRNSRFYCLLYSFVLSILAVCAVAYFKGTGRLFYIRTEQVYGFLSLSCLYIALLIAPLYSLLNNSSFMKKVVFVRRGIGVSAAYFAFLHAGVAYFGQLSSTTNFGLLPVRYRWSLGLGTGGLMVLAVLAATSFDKVIAYMKFRNWKWLHRLIYAGGIAIILHVWAIGTHLAAVWVQFICFVLLCTFFGLETWRSVRSLAARNPDLEPLETKAVLFICIWGVWVFLLACLPGIVGNYHSVHYVPNTTRSRTR